MPQPPLRDLLEEAATRGMAALREEASRGRKVVGYFCTYAPLEIVHAAGFLPMRIPGGVGTATAADTLAPDFICPYMRLALERALAGEFDFLSGLVHCYTCDATCGLVNIWRENLPLEMVHTVPLPYNDTPEARRFLRAGLEELIEKLAGIGGRFDMDALERSMDLYHRIRAHLATLYEQRLAGPGGLTALEFLALVRAGFLMPPEAFLSLLEALPQPAERDKADNPAGIPVVVAGSLVEDPAALELIERSGGHVAAEDLCTGPRAFEPVDPGKGPDPIERAIDRILRHPPCPARARAEARLPVLLDLLERSGARGVVFLTQRFCTPHLADHPTLSRALKDRGYETIQVEIEETGVNEGQVRTRLEAFFEMIGG